MTEISFPKKTFLGGGFSLFMNISYISMQANWVWTQMK